jgi:hypothetical protein
MRIFGHRAGRRLALMILLVVVLAGPSAHAAAGACLPPPHGMVAWWPGDGNANDVRRDHDGTLVGGAGFVPGMVDQAFQFNGTDGFVRVGDSRAWTFGNGPFTVDLWVKFDRLGGRDPFIGHDEGGGEFAKWIFWYDAQGHRPPFGPALRFHINSPTLGPLDPVVFPWQPQVGVWYHVALTRSPNTDTRASRYKLFINGVRVARETDSHTIPDAAAPLTIGRAESFFLGGVIDEAEVFQRALRADQIKAIYDAGAAGKCKT